MLKYIQLFCRISGLQAPFGFWWLIDEEHPLWTTFVGRSNACTILRDLLLVNQWGIRVHRKNASSTAISARPVFCRPKFPFIEISR